MSKSTVSVVGWLTWVCLAAILPNALGQLSTASVNGTVRDSTGSVIPGAVVVLHNVDTGVERRTATNVAGNYVLFSVPSGSYTLEASGPGFSTNRLSPFTLVVNQTATFDFTLSIGGVEQTITVEAAGAEVQSATAELGAVVAQRQVLDLPLNGRNFTQLLQLTPGVSPISVSQNSGGTFTASAIGQFTFPAINGQNNKSNYWTLDGINNQETFTATYAVPPIVDAILEFKVQSHNDQAEFGGVMGGVVNVVTKSGTNELHGTMWEYLRNDAFDARNFFLRSVTPFKQNQFGVTAGGPVMLPRIYDGRNKTFFFLAYQGFRFRQPAQNFYRVPTAANLAGDLSDWPRQIYDPFTTRPDPNNPVSFIRDPFPNNRIPTNLLDPGMVAFAKATLPAPINTGVADRNALDTSPISRNQEEYSARVDQNLGTKDFFWFRYSGIMNNASSSGGRPALGSGQDNRARNIGLSWVRTFSPSSTLQAQLGRTRIWLDTVNRFRSLPAGFVDTVGFAPDFAGGFIGGQTIVPALNVAEFFSGGESDSLNNSANIWQEKATFSKVSGSHTFRMGGELNSGVPDVIYRNASSGFAVPQTGNPRDLANTGSPLASFLLGIPDSAGRRNVHETARWGGVMGFFFQDQWKLTPKLTVNLGLRYDRGFEPPYGAEGTESQNGGIETGAYDLTRGVYLVQKVPPPCAVRGRAPCIPDPNGKLPDHVEVEPRGKIYHDTTKNFQPRVGLAYRLSANTAIRSGFGIFFDNWATIFADYQNYEGSWPDKGQQLANNLNYPAANQPTPAYRAQKPFPGSSLFPDPTPFNQVGWYGDPNLKNPYSMQWNFGIQRQLNTSTVVSANYVGSGSRRLNLGTYYNGALTPGPGNPRDRAPFPYMTATYYERSIGRSNYNAFQFQLDKRYTSGLAYVVSYTWAKSIDIGCSGWYGVEGCSVQDPYHVDRERSVSAFDVTHLLSVNWLYELPIGSGKAFRTNSRALDYLIGNWQVNGIVLLRSGNPYNLTVAGDIPNTGNVVVRPNVVGDPGLSNRTLDQWFNKAAFAAPAQYTFGNLGRNPMRSDAWKNVDLSLFRQFPLGSEKRRLEFRGEAFNAFNHPIFGIPVSSFSSVNFARILSTANSPRQLQLGAKIIF